MRDTTQITGGFVDTYRETVDGVDAVMREHEFAMAVYELQDVLSFGIFVMQRWRRCMGQWNEWVSESIDRYDAEHHEVLRRFERDIIDLGRRVVAMADGATRDGYSIDRDAEFRGMLRELEACVNPIPAEFQRTVLRNHFDKAEEAYDRGATEDTANPFS